MSSSEEKLSVADSHEAFNRVREEEQNRYLFRGGLVTPESVLSEMRRKGIDSWDQIQMFDRLNRSGFSRVTQLVATELQKEIEGSM